MPDQIVANIEVETRHGFKYLVVRVMKRECIDPLRPNRLADHPLNIGSGVYAEDAPFHGLEMSGHFADRPTGHDLVGFRPMYYHVAFVELAQSKAMTKMLGKIERELHQSQAREVGDMFMAFCKAVGIKSVAICHVPPNQRRSTISENEWRFVPIEEGRDRVRSLHAAGGVKAA